MDEIINTQNSILLKLKSVPKKYYIVGGIALLILICFFAINHVRNKRKNDDKKAQKSIEKRNEFAGSEDTTDDANQLSTEEIGIIYNDYLCGKISCKSAIELLKVSRSKFYKDLKKIKDAGNSKVNE
jgi:hypothetical protein